MRTVHTEFPWRGKSVMVGKTGLGRGVPQPIPVARRYLGRMDLALPNGASDPANPRRAASACRCAGLREAGPVGPLGPERWLPASAEERAKGEETISEILTEDTGKLI